MTTSPLITVIVLIHNSGATLRRTLDSLEQNRCPGTEFLLIDDGSSDNSLPIARSHIADKANYRLISLPSPHGTAYATAIGLREAAGQYVIRLDSDDYLDPDSLPILFHEASRTEPDVIVFPFAVERTSSNGSLSRSKVISMDSADVNLNNMPVDTLHFSLCNKLIRKSLIVSHRLWPFEGIDRWEDLGVMARVWMLSPHTVVLRAPLYHYTSAPGRNSLSRRDRELILRDHIALATQLELWARTHNLLPRFEPFLTRLKFCAKVKFLRHSPRRLRQWKATFPEVNARILSIRHVPLLYRLIFRIAALIPT